MKRVLSGIQPSGDITLGNYIGAMRQFVELQHEAECLFCVVDLHAVTVPQEPQLLRKRSRELAAFYIAVGGRVMSLDDPSKKMSKSNPNQASYILLLDPPDVIRKKISRAVTDSDMQVKYDWENKPAVSNLIEIYSICADESIETIEKRYEGQGYGVFKKDLAEVMVNKLTPIQERFHELIDSEELDRILKEGARKAAELAAPTLREVKERMGFLQL
jgi:tryptophanyl-tRNA synthetase